MVPGSRIARSLPAAAGDGQEVAFPLLGFGFGAGLFALQGGLVGRVVLGRGHGEGFDQRLPGAGEVAGRQRLALGDQEPSRRCSVGVLNAGHRGDGVQDPGQHLGLTGGHRPGRQPCLHHGVAADGLGGPHPGARVDAGEPEPVTEPAHQRQRLGAGLEVAGLGLPQQRALQCGHPGGHVEQSGEAGLDVVVGELPDKPEPARVQASAAARIPVTTGCSAMLPVELMPAT